MLLSMQPPGTSVELGVWTMAEAGILIIAVCLPSLWPLVKRIIPHCLLSYASAFDSTPKTPSKDRSTFLSKQSTLRRKTSAQSDSVGFTRLGMLPADDWNAATDISAHVHDSENGSQRSESIPMDRITVRKEVHLRTGPSSHLPDSF
ncbi:MAG: hypothetical protein M1834_001082 [Cirrosporium novae-zelandiae]|nr:MAG: hypothetical protein M1834_001082 [Cirrosporium novae-zelandiae]